MSSSQQNNFDNVMLQVGYSGRFQNVYNIVFNFCFITICTLIYSGVIISVAIPDHWCKRSENRHLNLTSEERSNLSQQWNNNESKFSQCSMYNDAGEVTECANGWEYDRTYYSQTIPTQENWVCQRELYVANFLLFGKIGDIIGTAFVQFGDVYGRKPLLYAAIIILLIGRLGLLVSKGYFWLFAMFYCITSIPSLAVYQAPLVIAMEMSTDEKRTRISLTQSLAYAAALCGGPLLFWVFNDWVTFTLITTIPLIIFLFMQPIMIESPRWLISKGYIKKSLKELKKIATLNNSSLSEAAILNLNSSPAIIETKNYSFIILFTRWKLAKKTILIITEWICYMTVYSLIFLNVTNLKGNPFLNYFWQALAELPGYFLGKYLSDKFGRKFTIFVGYTGASLISLVFVYVLTSFEEQVLIISICGIVIKFTISFIYFTLNLQTLEIYPTCLRQTGSSMGFLIANIFGVMTPYIIFLGTTQNIGFPYMVSASLCIFGAIVSVFLPETYNQKLPETISEAEEFGQDQAIMNLFHLKKEVHSSVPNNEI